MTLVLVLQCCLSQVLHDLVMAPFEPLDQVSFRFLTGKTALLSCAKKGHIAVIQKNSGIGKYIS